ncbi:beta-ketoacyl-ACP synthase III [Floccifex sp.]|uniref:beta-ketoacyl-ACP synthase III n=1 Tax=Floccifex sp. TaxID=2815810 RepID=UPI003EFDC6C2
MENVKIIGCGYAKAEKKLFNTDLEKIVDTSDEWIVQRTGIHSRYITQTKNTSDLAFEAAKKAIKDAQIDVSLIDCILVATTTPDCITPSTACLVQEKLGLNGQECTSFDLNAACSGFVYGLSLASMMLETYSTILVIGAETLSKIIDWNDRNTCVLFGDGAGAALIQKSNQGRMVSFTKSTGDKDGFLMCKGLSLQEKEMSYLEMNGKEVFRFAIEAMPYSIEKVLEKANQKIEDIDLFIPHQANIRILKHVAKKMKIDFDRIFVNLDEFGNTSSASIAIALAQAKEQGKIKKGMKMVLTGFGAGFTSGAIYLEW